MFDSKEALSLVSHSLQEFSYIGVDINISRVGTLLRIRLCILGPGCLANCRYRPAALEGAAIRGQRHAARPIDAAKIRINSRVTEILDTES